MNHPSAPTTQAKPILVEGPPPTSENSTTQKLVDGAAKSLARLEFKRARSCVVFAYWDPNINGGAEPAGAGFPPPAMLASDGTPLSVLGMLTVGRGQTSFTLQFDMPYGQLVAIPVEGDYVELRARLIVNQGNLTVPTFTPSSFNNPAQYAPITPGATLPGGAVQVSGLISTGSAYPANGAMPTKSVELIVAELPAAAALDIPLAWGARRVRLVGDSFLTLGIATVNAPNPLTGNLAPNVTHTLPDGTIGVVVQNPSAGAATQSAFLIYELGL